MKLRFTINPNLPLEEIHSSMQLDSGTNIATLRAGDFQVELRVEGDVKVFWNPDPDGSWNDEAAEMYRNASQMPEELLRIFGEGGYTDRKDLGVCNNNWYENYVFYKGVLMCADVSDIEDLDPADIFASLWDIYTEVKENEDDIEKDYRKAVRQEREDTEAVPAYDIVNAFAKAPMNREQVHDLLAGTLFDRWDYPVGRLNEMHFRYDARGGRDGRLIGA